MGKLLAIVLTKAAEGDFGEPVQKAYWALAGAKTVIGGFLLFMAGVIEAGKSAGLCATYTLDCDGWLATVQYVTGLVGTLFLLIGQVDGALREQRPLAPPKAPPYL